MPGGLRDPTGPRGRIVQEAKDARQGRDVGRRATVLSHVEALEAQNPNPEPLASPLLAGRWRLIYTTSDSILGVNRSWLFRPRPRILQHINPETLAAYDHRRGRKADSSTSVERRQSVSSKNEQDRSRCGRDRTP